MDNTKKKIETGSGAAGSAAEVGSSAALDAAEVGSSAALDATEVGSGAALDALLAQGTDDDVRNWYYNLADAVKQDFLLFEDELVICDTETTGPNPAQDSLIQIAAIKICGKKQLGSFQTYVNPGISISEEITELTGISNKMVENAPDPSLAVEQFAAFVGDCNLVAHNAAFDQEVIMRQALPSAISGEWIDTLALARIVFPHFKAHRLHSLAKAFSLHKPTHSAIDDVETLAELWRILIAALHCLPQGLAGAIAQISPKTDWPLRQFFKVAAAAKKQDFSLRRCRKERVASTNARKEKDVLPVFPGDEEIAAAFSKQGIAGKMYPAYVQRPEQLEMALQVTHALKDGSYRIIEAGTGVGKSMAYLLPCAIVAQQNDICIGVATKTNALLDQLMYSELPRLSKALGGLSYVALKGYDHYPCLRKTESFMRGEKNLEVPVIQMLAMLVSYISRINWGDLDSLSIFWRDLPRYAIEANSNDCLKNKCPFSRTCFVRGARANAAKASIVVTNHSLLFRDAEAKASGFGKGLLPEIKNWIVDEAHTAESEARGQFSEKISATELRAQVFQLISSRSGVIKNIQNKASSLDGGDMLYSVLTDIELKCSKVQSLSEVFFTLMKDLASLADTSSNYDRLTLWISPQLRDQAAFQNLLEPGHNLLDALSALIKHTQNLVSLSEQFEELAVQRATLTGVLCSLQDMTSALELVLSGENTSYVYSAEINRKSDKFTEQLFAQKIDIGAKLSYMFYPLMDSMVFTSATLATGEKDNPFAYFKHSIGLDYLEEENRLQELQLHSSYDFENNMKIILPKDMPQPNAQEYFESMEQLLLEVHTAMQGSVLTLFTNRAQMEKLYYKLKPVLAQRGIELRAQTRGTNVKVLRETFIEDKKMSIFALRSFWEGFDAPGDTLRCVVIAKIPFGRPDDPLSCERNLREGRSAWSKYSLPEAVMDLKQAAGRLIRGETDKGYLVLADARLQTKPYGRVFLNAMPSSNIARVPIEELSKFMTP